MDEYKKMLKKINLKDKKYQQILDYNVTKWISTFQVGGHYIDYGGLDEGKLRDLLDDPDNTDNTRTFVPKGKNVKGDFNNSKKLITQLKTLDPSTYLILFNNIEQPIRNSILKAFQNNDDRDVKIKFQKLTVLLSYQNININKLNENEDVIAAVAAAAAGAPAVAAVAAAAGAPAAPTSIDIRTNRFVTIASPISQTAPAGGAVTTVADVEYNLIKGQLKYLVQNEAIIDCFQYLGDDIVYLVEHLKKINDIINTQFSLQ